MGELERETVPKILGDEEGEASQRVFRFQIGRGDSEQVKDPAAA